MSKKVLPLSIKERFRLFYMRHFLSFYINWQWRHEKAEPCHIRTIKIAKEKLKLRIYTPQGEGPFSVLVYYHGGGFVLGDLNASDRGCRNLCVMTGMIVVSVAYRLAPECPFPLAVDDSLSAFDWVLTNVDEITLSVPYFFSTNILLNPELFET